MDEMIKHALARAKLRQDPSAMAAMKALGVSFEQAAQEMAGLLGKEQKKGISTPLGEQGQAARENPAHPRAMQVDSLPSAIVNILKNGPLRKGELFARLKATYPPFVSLSDPDKTFSNALVRLHDKEVIMYHPGPKPRLIQLVQTQGSRF